MVWPWASALPMPLHRNTLPAGIVTLGARASVRGSACMDKKRHNLDRLLQSASNFQHRQQMLSIQRDKALPKSGIIARDVLLALIFFLIPQGWSMSGFPPNIVLACGCWIIAALFLAHALLTYPALPKWLRISVILIIYALAISILWKPAQVEYAKEHQVIFVDIETWMLASSKYMAIPTIPPPGDQTFYFQLLVMLSDNQIIEVNRPRRGLERYLLLIGRIPISEQQHQALRNLSLPESQQVIADIWLELTAVRIS